MSLTSLRHSIPPKWHHQTNKAPCPFYLPPNPSPRAPRNFQWPLPLTKNNVDKILAVQKIAHLENHSSVMPLMRDGKGIFSYAKYLIQQSTNF